jgi:predicted ATPase
MPQALRGNLPLELSSFVGRVAELDQVHTLLDSSRLVTLTGPGGIGKSRLARHATAAVEGRYADGVWLVDLASATDGDGVARAGADALGLDRSLGLDGLEQAVRDKAVLLVLDNCEQVLGWTAALTRGVLEHGAAVRVLATSRQVLGVPGEAVWPTPSLSVPCEHETLDERLQRTEAACLFLERANAAAPGFILGADDVPLVAEICRRLDGVPLALELAAGRVRALGLRQVAQLVRDPARVLDLGTHTPGLPRHRSVRANLEWSYGLLAEAEQVLLRRVALLRGCWTLQDAKAVCDDTALPVSLLTDVLDMLVAKSLVLVKYQGVETHYWLLEVLRQYALEQLDDVGERTPRRRRRTARRAHCPLVAQLTPREHDVMALLARGFSNREIGTELVISKATARVHVEHILTKLALRSRTQAAVWAVHRGFMAPE